MQLVPVYLLAVHHTFEEEPENLFVPERTHNGFDIEQVIGRSVRINRCRRCEVRFRTNVSLCRVRVGIGFEPNTFRAHHENELTRRSRGYSFLCNVVNINVAAGRCSREIAGRVVHHRIAFGDCSGVGTSDCYHFPAIEKPGDEGHKIYNYFFLDGNQSLMLPLWRGIIRWRSCIGFPPDRVPEGDPAVAIAARDELLIAWALPASLPRSMSIFDPMDLWTLLKRSKIKLLETGFPFRFASWMMEIRSLNSSTNCFHNFGSS